MCARPPHDHAADAITPPSPAGKLCRILLADDNRDAVETLAMLLELESFTTCVAYDGLQAVAVALQCRPDVAIVDIDMPGLDGYDVARRLRKSGWSKQLTMIALTGRGSPADQTLALDAGFDAHLTKPSGPEEIIALVARLRGRPAWRSCPLDLAGANGPTPACASPAHNSHHAPQQQRLRV